MTSPRLHSLDQFRGYTVMGMILVNFVGGFDACHFELRHHNTFVSYADTIMPHFLFAVGFAFRLTFHRRLEREGAAAAYGRTIKRIAGLMLLALAVYVLVPRALNWRELAGVPIADQLTPILKREWFQALMHIAATVLWILPVVRASAATRVAFMILSVLAHMCLSHVFYFHWVNESPNGIDGGPLGFLTWTIPAVAGTLACDYFARHRNRPPLMPLLASALACMLLGYAMSCGTRLYDVDRGDTTEHPTKLAARPVAPDAASLKSAAKKLAIGNFADLLAEPPFVSPPQSDAHLEQGSAFRQWNYWMMSQRAGTPSYQAFAAGFSLLVFALFHAVCDRAGLQLAMFRTFGTNALLAYLLHMVVESPISRCLPRECPAPHMWMGLILCLGTVYLVTGIAERRGIYFRL